MCGKKSYQYCSLCNVPVHYNDPRKEGSAPCFFLYHDTGCLGLARSDCKKVGSPKGKWAFSSTDDAKDHCASMEAMHTEMAEEHRRKNALKSPPSVNNRPTENSNNDNGNNNDNDNNNRPLLSRWNGTWHGRL